MRKKEKEEEQSKKKDYIARSADPPPFQKSRTVLSKRECQITYSVTKRDVHFMFCNGIRFVTLYIM
jgi:hypothetical protein